MNLFGFTIIRTDELKQERAKNLQAIKELNEKVEKDYEELKKRGEELKKKGEELDAFIQKQALEFFEQTQKEKDIELRKWCVEKGMWCRGCDVGEYAELIYRYVTTGDTAIFAELKEFREWKKENEKKAKEKKASKSHQDSPSQ